MTDRLPYHFMMDLHQVLARFRKPRNTTTAEDNILRAPDENAHNRSDAEVIAIKKVFGTYELLECIILQLDPRDIPAMSAVNKACHDITLTTSVTQYLMSSNYFCHKAFGVLEDGLPGLCCIIPDTLLAQKLREPRLFILQRGGKETIMAIARSAPDPARSVPVFLADKDDVPGLTAKDRALLSWDGSKHLRLI